MSGGGTEQVEPERYELWDEDYGDEGQFRCAFCEGRVLRVGNKGQCLEDCGARFQRPDENSLWRANR